jgi:hypothetical protein
MVDPDLDDRDEEVLDVMRTEGRANPYLLRQETGIDKGDINTSLNRLASHHFVQKVTRGLYEYTGDDTPDMDGVRDARDDLLAAIERSDPEAIQRAADRLDEALGDPDE